MFEAAAKMKLRFETPMGRLAAEDLFDLPLTSTRGISLNDIAVNLHHQLQQDTVSFVRDEEKPDPVLQLRFDLVKHVIDVKKEENRLLRDAREKAERKQKILGILAQKQDAALEGKSEDELRELLAAL